MSPPRFRPFPVEREEAREDLVVGRKAGAVIVASAAGFGHRGVEGGMGVDEPGGAGIVSRAEATLAPEFGSAFIDGGFSRALFESEPVAFGLAGDGGVGAEQGAEVVEVRLRGGAYLEGERRASG